MMWYAICHNGLARQSKIRSVVSTSRNDFCILSLKRVTNTSSLISEELGCVSSSPARRTIPTWYTTTRMVGLRSMKGTVLVLLDRFCITFVLIIVLKFSAGFCCLPLLGTCLAVCRPVPWPYVLRLFNLCENA